jgi:hypothetical protein
MGLIGGMARTAVVAGTATAVSNRVSRRQSNRWAQNDQSMYTPAYMAPQPAQPQYAQPVYQQAPPPPPAPAPQPAIGAGSDDTLAQLRQLADLHTQGILTDAEFAAAKAKILS